MKNRYTGKPVGPRATAKIAVHRAMQRKARRNLRSGNPSRRDMAERVIRRAEKSIDDALRGEVR